MSTPLAELHTDLTQRRILDSALEFLENASVGELTVRAVAKRAGMSERTIFRYFSTRDEFLDAIAREVTRNLDMPPHPQTIEELLALPRGLYQSFEGKEQLAKAALHSDIFPRMRAGAARQRWVAVKKLLDRAAPHASEGERKIAAANIRFFLGATAWHYYRFIFGFTLEETIACAETAIRQALASLRESKS
jgi:AcrR family transcriptional regulator